MESYRLHFPKQADRETLALDITDVATVPSGTFLVFDSYCTNPECDENHILLMVAMIKPPTQRPMALLTYRWESKNPTNFTLEIDCSSEMKPTHNQAFRDIMDNELRTNPSYAKVLRSHFKQFRAFITMNKILGTGNRAL